MLEKNEVYYTNKFCPLKKFVKFKENNSFTFLVRLGNFETKIKLLKMYKLFPKINEPILGLGNFGTIYQFNFSQKNYAMKIQNIYSKYNHEANQYLD